MKAKTIGLSTTRSMLYRLSVFAASILASAPVVYGDAGDAALALLQDNTDGPPDTYRVGIYLKQVSGPVLEQFNESFIFEPASTIKVLHHLHAMLQVEAGNIGINIGVAAPMAFYPFSGWGESFFGDLHGQGRHAVEFYTQTKVVVERWPREWSRKF